MIVGCVTEIKNNEYRVGLTPYSVAAYVAEGHQVLIQSGAGVGSGFTDEMFREQGASIHDDAKTIWDSAEMIVKVKEPLESEYALIRENQILFTYLHLAANETLLDILLERKCIAIAYETICDQLGGLPLLKPMSEIAGRLSVTEGAHALSKSQGGNGILLSGIPGVERGNIVILGAGIVGSNACKIAVGMEANVTIIDINSSRLTALDYEYGNKIQTLYSSDSTVQNALKDADLVIGSVLLPGKKAPKLIKREYLKQMKEGSVIVDVAIDQGGCAETSKPTTHDNPTYVVDGVVHYCVANMPGAVARTSTIGLSNATLRYGISLANLGVKKAAMSVYGLLEGINCYKGLLTSEAVASSFDREFSDITNSM